VRFYAVHSDYRALLQEAERMDLLALPKEVATGAYDRRGKVEALPPTAFEADPAGGSYYLVPAEVPVVEVFYHALRPDPARSYLAARVSPVVEIGPCRREGNRLYHSRIYIQTPRTGPEAGPGAGAAHRAYDRLARYLRSWTRVAQNVYAGPTTAARLALEAVRLMVFDRPLAVEMDALPPPDPGLPLDWVEIPAGSFTCGLTAAQRDDLAERLYAGYGIDDLAEERRAWVAGTLDKPPSAFTPKERELWRRETLLGNSPALAYRHAYWALHRIPEAKALWLPTFYIARLPITRAQAGVFYRSEVAGAMGWALTGNAAEVDRPAAFADWSQAQALAHWLGGRLPTPLEWEKAARGTDGRLYPWGDVWDPAAGRFRTSACREGGATGKRSGLITAADAYPEGASPYGLLDMVGNLSEWHGLTERNDVGAMGFSFKEMSRTNPWFYALPVHRRPRTRRQLARYVGCRPVLEVWGRHLWPGYRCLDD
jgi:formylglycine-generating enzyme required for sulfatase activity